jgi:hypothetical protein
MLQGNALEKLDFFEKIHQNRFAVISKVTREELCVVKKYVNLVWLE